jgi:hypothetical protein
LSIVSWASSCSVTKNITKENEANKNVEKERKKQIVQKYERKIMQGDFTLEDSDIDS